MQEILGDELDFWKAMAALVAREMKLYTSASSLLEDSTESLRILVGKSILSAR